MDPSIQEHRLWGRVAPLFISAAAIQHEIMHAHEKNATRTQIFFKKKVKKGKMTCLYSLILMVKTSPVLDLNT
jgi:hypothetical protein